ncbi:MAG: hypothetical protein Kow0031_28890 [Anaerolineae bacterium]
MTSLWQNYWKILKLDPEPFDLAKQAGDGIWFALKLFVVVALIAGLGKLVGLGQVLERPTLAHQAGAVAQSIEERAAGMRLPVAVRAVNDVAGIFRAVESKLEAVQPPLGVGASRTLRLIGNWLATPFELLASWLGFIIVIWLFARFMGGQATITQHVSLLLLAVAPQVLTIINYMPLSTSAANAPAGILGRLLSLVALVWSLVIVVNGLAVAHQVERRDAVKILAVFVVVVFVVLPILGLLAGVYVLDGAR